MNSAYGVIRCCRLPSLQTKVIRSSSLEMETTTGGTAKDVDVAVADTIALAKKALMASREAASLAEESKLVGTDSDDTLPVRLALFTLV